MTLILNGDTGLSDVDGSAATPAIRGTDSNTGVFFPAADRLGFATDGTQRGEFDASGNFQFNSGYGSVATAYGCRAWVNFAGDGTVAIRASGNVTSISDNGVGDYTMNFTTALSDANYAVVGIVGNASAATFGILTGPRTSAATTSAFRFLTTTAGPTNTDYPVVQLAVFR